MRTCQRRQRTWNLWNQTTVVRKSPPPCTPASFRPLTPGGQVLVKIDHVGDITCDRAPGNTVFSGSWSQGQICSYISLPVTSTSRKPSMMPPLTPRLGSGPGLCVEGWEGWEVQGRPSLLAWGQATAKGLVSGPTLLVSVRQALEPALLMVLGHH